MIFADGIALLRSHAAAAWVSATEAVAAAGAANGQRQDTLPLLHIVGQEKAEQIKKLFFKVCVTGKEFR